MNTPTLSSIPQDIDKVLEEVTHKIVDIFHPEQIILFGSYAYGTPTRDSDVDLLVIMNTEDRPSERSLRITQVCRPRYVSEDFRTAITMVRKRKDPVPDNVCFCAQQCVWTGYPFWSPQSDYLVFQKSGQNGRQVLKVAASGGAGLVLTTNGGGVLRAGTWGPIGTIIIAHAASGKRGTLLSGSDRGGPLTRYLYPDTTLSELVGFGYPHVLPVYGYLIPSEVRTHQSLMHRDLTRILPGLVTARN